MKDIITKNEDLDRILMLMKTNPETIFLVEGGTEKKLFFPWVNQSSVYIYFPKHANDNKNKIIEIHNAVLCHNLFGFVALIDYDYDSIFDKSIESPNLIYTQNHDLSVDMFLSKSLDKFLLKKGSLLKIYEKFNGMCKYDNILEIPETVRARLISRVQKYIFSHIKPFGIIRFMNQKYNYNFGIDNMILSKISKHQWDTIFDIDNIINLLKRSKQITNWEIFKTNFKSEVAADYPLPIICNGHDIFALLGKLLRKDWGSITKKDQNNIEINFNDIAELIHFKETAVYEKILEWADNNGITFFNN